MGTDVALRVSDVSLSFSGVRTLRSVSFDVPAGALVSLIGPNGAGKTSLLNCLTGYYRPDSGRISAFGHDLTRRPPHRVARLGVARTYQNVGLFAGMTVLDNLLVGRHLKGRRSRREVAEDLLDRLGITHLRGTLVGRLPYGVRKRVELGRVLAMEPRLLLLDEPMAGMSAGEKREMVEFVRTAQSGGMTVLLVEHDMAVVMGVSDAVAVLDFGHLIAYGPAADVARDPAVVAAYLGADPAVPA